MLLLLM